MAPGLLPEGLEADRRRAGWGKLAGRDSGEFERKRSPAALSALQNVNAFFPE